MHKDILFLLLLSPALAHANPCIETTTEIIKSENRTYSVSATFSRHHPLCVDKLENNAEIFCIKQNRHYAYASLAMGKNDSKLIFKCITDKNEADRLRRLHETQFDGRSTK